MNSQDMRGTNLLRIFLEEHCTPTTVSAVMKKVKVLLDQEFTFKPAFTPLFSAVFHSNRLTIMIKNDLGNILTEVELIKLGKGSDITYALHYRKWDDVPKQNHLAVSLARLQHLVRDVRYYFSEQALKRLDRHMVIKDGKNVVITFNFKMMKNGLIIDKLFDDEAFLTLTLQAEKGEINVNSGYEP